MLATFDKSPQHIIHTRQVTPIGLPEPSQHIRIDAWIRAGEGVTSFAGFEEALVSGLTLADPPRGGACGGTIKAQLSLCRI